jgi:hypothetical protein
MSKVPILPADPVEAAQVPVKGVDLPEEDTAAQIEGNRAPPAGAGNASPSFVENEGLVRKETHPAAPEEGELDEAAKAALRGRTA